MRVAVHFPEGHPLAQDGAGVAAYALGRIEDGVHNAPPGHDPVPLGDFLGRLIQRAQAEYPDCQIVVERLVDNGDGTARWIPATEFVPEQHTPVGPGQQVAREVSAEASAQSPEERVV